MESTRSEYYRAVLARCQAEIERCREQLLSGKVDVQGSVDGLADWCGEKRMIETEQAEEIAAEEFEYTYTELKAPFPWFGGKSRVASLVWDYFGNVDNYVEPFAGSLAVLLGRPHAPQTETVNDLDCYLSNFWRAMTRDPVSLAYHSDWPVNEADLHARHLWLVNQDEFRERMKTDPDFYDVKIAGWWVWGISQWIGSGWCSRPEWTGRTNAARTARGIHGAAGNAETWNCRPALNPPMGVHRQMPELGAGSGAKRGHTIHKGVFSDQVSTFRKRPMIHGGHFGKGVHQEDLSVESVTQKLPKLGNKNTGGVHAPHRKLPSLGDDGRGVARQIPHLGNAGMGVNATPPEQIPHLADAGMGVHAKRPHLSGRGTGIGIHSDERASALAGYFEALYTRLRRVRVCCGDWKRVTGPSVTVKHGVCGIFLDPPYDMRVVSRPETGRDGAAPSDGLYANHDNDLSREVREWAIANGANPLLRIALCGYEGEHRMPEDWACVPWKAHGGYGSQRGGKGNDNANRERIWFSPHCLTEGPLFSGGLFE